MHGTKRGFLCLACVGGVACASKPLPPQTARLRAPFAAVEVLKSAPSTDYFYVADLHVTADVGSFDTDIVRRCASMLSEEARKYQATAVVPQSPETTAAKSGSLVHLTCEGTAYVRKK